MFQKLAIWACVLWFPSLLKNYFYKRGKPLVFYQERKHQIANSENIALLVQVQQQLWAMYLYYYYPLFCFLCLIALVFCSIYIWFTYLLSWSFSFQHQNVLYILCPESLSGTARLKRSDMVYIPMAASRAFFLRASLCSSASPKLLAARQSAEKECQQIKLKLS